GGHRRVAVQGDAGADQVAVQVGPGQQGGGVGDVLQRDGADLVGERLTRGVEDLDLLVGGGVGRVVGAGQVGPGGDQLEELVVPHGPADVAGQGRCGAVAAHAGIDLQVHPGAALSLLGGGARQVQHLQRAHRDIDAGADHLGQDLLGGV